MAAKNDNLLMEMTTPSRPVSVRSTTIPRASKIDPW